MVKLETALIRESNLCRSWQPDLVIEDMLIGNDYYYARYSLRSRISLLFSLIVQPPASQPAKAPQKMHQKQALPKDKLMSSRPARSSPHTLVASTSL